MNEIFNRTTEKEKRRELRKAMPRAEVLLWQRLKGRQVHACKFRRQYSVGPYIVDFYSPEIKLGVELDGDSHYQEGVPERDHERQEYIETFGIKIVRFTNIDVLENMDGVLDSLAKIIDERRTASPPPAPPFQGGEA